MTCRSRPTSRLLGSRAWRPGRRPRGAVAAAGDQERAELRTQLVELTDAVRLEKLSEVGDELDAIHSVERALFVGSVHRITPAATLLPALIDAVRRGTG